MVPINQGQKIVNANPDKHVCFSLSIDESLVYRLVELAVSIHNYRV